MSYQKNSLMRPKRDLLYYYYRDDVNVFASLLDLSQILKPQHAIKHYLTGLDGLLCPPVDSNIDKISSIMQYRKLLTLLQMIHLFIQIVYFIPKALGKGTG